MIDIFKTRTSGSKSLGSRNFFESLASNRRVLLLTLIFAAGMLIGAGVVRSNADSLIVKLLTLFNNYREVKEAQSIIVNFCNSFINSFIYLLVVYCAGLCAVGTPLIYAVPMIRGLGLGIISGYLYNAYALKGVGYSALIIYPGVIFSVVALLTACNEGILMSKDVLTLLTNRGGETETGYKLYCVRFVIFSVVTAFGAVAETFFYMMFSRFFTF
ncbi:MAG: stage II sporulation protein M [Oscillospiraceae bacterium]|nr:stage II sporulation protein M [Oscillospiraceae bacterium]